MTTTEIYSRKPDPGIFFESVNAYQRSAALKAAIELDLFTVIACGHRSVDAIARAVRASARGIRILCDYLTIRGFLEKTGDEYSLTLDSATFLDRNSPAYLGSITTFLLDPRLLAPFLQLTDVVRAGTTTLPEGGTVSHDNPIWVDFAKQMAPMMLPAGTEMAALVAGDGEKRVLDIAAGHGMFGILIAQQNPKARITALDWPNVLAVAAGNAEKFGVASRHTLLPGDAFQTEFDGPYDLVLVTNFFHHFDPPTCEKLMRKIRAALASEGLCVTLDFIPNDDRVTPHVSAEFAMTMLGTTASGDAYTFDEYQTMFRNAGYSSSSFHPLTRAMQCVIVSRV